MNKLPAKIRIKDIARKAGVSEGTVDRVLHNRGEVSEKSRSAVLNALNLLGYTPNLVARSLASKKHFHFIALIPEHKPNEYWDSVVKGFEAAEAAFVHHHVSLEVIYYNQFDGDSFAVSTDKVLRQKPDAVIIAPIFKYETLQFTQQLNELAIPFSFIDSLVEEANYHTYYGQHSSQSGLVGSKLLFDSLGSNAKVVVVRIKRKGVEYSNQTNSRYGGFLKYINEIKKCYYELIHVELVEGDENKNKELLKAIFKDNPDINGMITFNSKAFRLAAFLKEMNHRHVVLVGYDLLEENIKYLKEGVISYLLAQRPDKQAFMTVSDLCNLLIFNTEIKRINYMPIDILMKENIDYYCNFKD